MLKSLTNSGDRLLYSTTKVERWHANKVSFHGGGFVVPTPLGLFSVSAPAVALGLIPIVVSGEDRPVVRVR